MLSIDMTTRAAEGVLPAIDSRVELTADLRRVGVALSIACTCFRFPF